MHVNEMQELVDKVLLADNIITEQQLGWRWLASPAHLMPKPAALKGRLDQLKSWMCQ